MFFYDEKTKLRKFEFFDDVTDESEERDYISFCQEEGSLYYKSFSFIILSSIFFFFVVLFQNDFFYFYFLTFIHGMLTCKWIGIINMAKMKMKIIGI